MDAEQRTHEEKNLRNFKQMWGENTKTKLILKTERKRKNKRKVK